SHSVTYTTLFRFVPPGEALQPGQEGGPHLKIGRLLDGGQGGGGLDQHGDLAGDEGLVGRVLPAAVDENALLRPAPPVGDHLHTEGAVEEDLGGPSRPAVGVVGVELVVGGM